LTTSKAADFSLTNPGSRMLGVAFLLPSTGCASEFRIQKNDTRILWDRVSFVANRDQEVVFWEQSVSP
jgi:hypothetical protein